MPDDMPQISIEQMGQAREIIAKINALREARGADPIPQPQPLAGEIKTNELAAGPLALPWLAKEAAGRLGSFFSGQEYQPESTPFDSRQAQLWGKTVLDRVPFGLGKLARPLLFEGNQLAIEGLQPKNLGEQFITGGASLAADIPVMMATMGLVPPGVNALGRSIITGAGMGALEGISGPEAMQTYADPYMTLGEKARGITGKVLGGATGNAALFGGAHWLGAMAKRPLGAYFASPEGRAMITGVTKRFGPSGAQALVTGSEALVNGFTQGALGAGVGAIGAINEGVPEQALPSAIVQGGLLAIMGALGTGEFKADKYFNKPPVKVPYTKQGPTDIMIRPKMSAFDERVAPEVQKLYNDLRYSVITGGGTVIGNEGKVLSNIPGSLTEGSAVNRASHALQLIEATLLDPATAAARSIRRSEAWARKTGDVWFADELAKAAALAEQQIPNAAQIAQTNEVIRQLYNTHQEYKASLASQQMPLLPEAPENPLLAQAKNLAVQLNNNLIEIYGPEVGAEMNLRIKDSLFAKGQPYELGKMPEQVGQAESDLASFASMIPTEAEIKLRAHKNLKPVEAPAVGAVPPKAEAPKAKKKPWWKLDQRGFIRIGGGTSTPKEAKEFATEQGVKNVVDESVQAENVKEYYGKVKPVEVALETKPYDPNVKQRVDKGTTLVSDQEKVEINQNLPNVDPTQFNSAIEQLPNQLANCLPGGYNNPLYKIADWIVRGDMVGKTTAKAALSKVKDAFMKGGFLDMDKFGSVHWKDERRYMMWREKEYLNLAELGEKPFNQQEIDRFTKADAVLNPVLDEYYDKLVQRQQRLGLPVPPKVQNYIPWIEDFSAMFELTKGNLDFVGNKFMKPQNRNLRYANPRGDTPPEQRLGLFDALMKYTEQVDLAIQHDKTIHTLNYLKGQADKLKNLYAGNITFEELVANEQASPTPLNVQATGYAGPDNTKMTKYKMIGDYFGHLRDKLTGTQSYGFVEQTLMKSPIGKFLLELTKNWTNNVVTSFTIPLTQALGLAPTAGMTSTRNMIEGLGQTLKEDVGYQLLGMMENKKYMSFAEQNSTTLRARHLLGEEAVFAPSRGHGFKGLENTAKTLKGAYYRFERFSPIQVLKGLAQAADRLFVAAAFNAGYKQGRGMGLTHEEAIKRGDYIAGITQGWYNSSLKPLLLQTPLGQVIAPLSTSSMAAFKVLQKQALIGLNPQQKALAIGRIIGTSLAVNIALSLVRPQGSPAKVLEDTIVSQLPVIGGMLRFGGVGALTSFSNLADAKTMEQAARSAITIFGPAGSKQLYDSSQAMLTLARDGIVRDKNGRSLYQITEPQDFARALLFSRRSTAPAVTRTEKLYPALSTRLATLISELFD